MVSKRNGILLMAGGFAMACSASAQIDGARYAGDLRAKYGPALARETFMVRPGIEMIVDFAANGHVCRIELPPVAPGPEPGVLTPRAIDGIVAELVPLAMRGRELGTFIAQVGLPSLHSVEFENVTISEAFQDKRRTGVTVSFKADACERQAHP